MFKPFISFIAGTAVALTSAVSLPVGATEERQNPHVSIIGQVLEVGYDVLPDSEECAEEPGLLGYVSPTLREFVICTGNITHDEQFYSVIRHEAIHVAQLCNYGPILPEYTDYFIQRAQDNGWHTGHYHEAQWAMEAEARVLSGVLDAEQVAGLVYTHCNA